MQNLLNCIGVLLGKHGMIQCNVACCLKVWYIFRNYSNLKPALSIRDLLTKFCFLIFSVSTSSFSLKGMTFSLTLFQLILEALISLKDCPELVLIIQTLTSAIPFWRPSFSLRMAFSLAFCFSLFLPQQCNFRGHRSSRVWVGLLFQYFLTSSTS